MSLFPGLVRRVAAEAERRLRAGAGLLAEIAGDPGRAGETERALAALDDRVRAMEDTLAGQGRELRTLRTDLDSLVTQLNERLLPRIDERMDDSERDLTTLATGQVRTAREAAAGRARLETVEGRVADLRAKLAQMEQRASLWRELQATMARLGDDVDALRSRLAPPSAASRPAPAPAPAPALREQVSEVGESLSGTDAHP